MTLEELKEIFEKTDPIEFLLGNDIQFKIIEKLTPYCYRTPRFYRNKNIIKYSYHKLKPITLIISSDILQHNISGVESE